MKFTVVTILPELIEPSLTAGVVGRAREAGTITVRTINPREFTHDRHKTVDDTPYGGGPGMVMKAEPLLAAIERAASDVPPRGGASGTAKRASSEGGQGDDLGNDLSGDPDDVLATGRFDRASLRELAAADEEDILSTGRFTRPSMGDLQKRAQAKSDVRRKEAEAKAAERALAALEGTAKDDQGDALDDETAARALEELERQAREREADLAHASTKREQVRGTLTSVDESIGKLEGALGGNLDALAASTTGEEKPSSAATENKGPVSKPHRILLSPSGKPLTQARVRELAKLDHLVLVCGRYEGIDQRVIDLAIDEEISIGDYVLSGGELGALVIIDAVSRYVPGVLGEATSVDDESFSAGLLEYPQYTKPAELRGKAVPPVLLSGNHALVAAWRRDQSMRRTAARRPDLWRGFQPTKADAKAFPPLRARTHLALVHHPIVDRTGAVVTTAVTNFDIHDLARSSMAFGLAGYHLVTPITSQREKAQHIAELWIGDEQGEHRARALRLVRTSDTIEAVIQAIREQHGLAPLVVATSAKPTSFPGAARRTSSELLAEASLDPAPLLILLGTGWGLADHLIPSVSRILAPIEGASDWNHLSVRSAGAVILDRLFGRPA